MPSKNSPIAHDLTPVAAPAFEIQFISDAFAVRDALEKLSTAWERWDVAEGPRIGAEQALAEVLNNVVEHAHAGRDDGAVIVKSVRVGEELRIEVLDNGGPLPEDVLLQRELATAGDELDALPEGGFGWFMIHALTDDLSYMRQDGWNRLQFKAKEM